MRSTLSPKGARAGDSKDRAFCKCRNSRPPPRGEGGPRQAYSSAVAGRMRGYIPARDDHLPAAQNRGLAVYGKVPPVSGVPLSGRQALRMVFSNRNSAAFDTQGPEPCGILRLLRTKRPVKRKGFPTPFSPPPDTFPPQQLR